MAARRAHNPKVPGSSPGPATNFYVPNNAEFTFWMYNSRAWCNDTELPI